MYYLEQSVASVAHSPTPNGVLHCLSHNRLRTTSSKGTGQHQTGTQQPKPTGSLWVFKMRRPFIRTQCLYIRNQVKKFLATGRLSRGFVPDTYSFPSSLLVLIFFRLWQNHIHYKINGGLFDLKLRSEFEVKDSIIQKFLFSVDGLLAVDPGYPEYIYNLRNRTSSYWARWGAWEFDASVTDQD